MTASDVLVVGAGVIGLTTAWYLRQRGASVTVLEAGRAGREASWAGGGILWPIYPWRYPRSVQAMGQRGAALHPALCADLAARTGIDPEWRRTGVVVLDSAEREAAIAWAERSESRYETLTPNELADWMPVVNSAEGAVFLPDAAQVRNPRLCQALVAVLRANGVAVHEHTPVRETVADHGQFAGFRGDHSVWSAGAGVVAAGAWSGHIAGIPNAPTVEPVKGQMLLFNGARDRIPHILVRRGKYLIPRADGRVLVGSTVERQAYDQTPTRAAHDELRDATELIAPAVLHGWRLEAQWSGLRPATPDGTPRVGRLAGIEGLFASLGHYRNGLLQAPAAAEMLVDYVLGTSAPTVSGGG